MKDTQKFGKLIKNLRLKNDLSLRDLEKKSGVSYSFISSIENNRYQPSRERVIALANALDGADANELLLLAGFAPEEEIELISKTAPQTSDDEAKKLSFFRDLEINLGVDLTDPEIQKQLKKAAKIIFSKEN